MNTPHLIAYCPLQDTQAQGYLEVAIREYVKSKGWPSLQSDNFAIDERGDGETLRTSLKLLQGGDVLLLPNVASISIRPSIQEQTILGLLGRGVRVHVLSLGGGIEPHLLALREAWDATLPLERERDAIERRAQLREKQIAKENAEFEADIVARMAERFGVKSLFATEQTVETTIGTYVRQAREAKGWTQDYLAKLARTSKAQVSRIERDGKGEALPKVLEALADHTPVVDPPASPDHIPAAAASEQPSVGV
jgi:DNA-binding XRE family transcriptional regulator